MSTLKMTKDDNQSLQKSCHKFGCEICDYYTSKHSSYIKHTLTAKHKKATNVAKKLPKSCQHVCNICMQEFSHRQSLWRHTRQNICNPDCASPPIVKLNNSQITGDITMLLQQQMTANNEFKQMMIEQTNQMLEMAKNTQVINNHTTNNNNQKYGESGHMICFCTNNSFAMVFIILLSNLICSSSTSPKISFIIL